MAATLRYLVSMFRHPSQTLVMALLPGPFGVL
jgi:hypothetical protein